MTITHQATTVSAATTSATAPVCVWPASIAAGDLIVMEVGTKGPGTVTSGSSEGPLDVATLRTAGWILAGTQTNGVVVPALDAGSTRLYVLIKIAIGTETGNLTLAVASADSTSVTMHRYTRDTSKHLSYQVTFGTDVASGTGWSVTFGENPGLKAGDKLLLAAAMPTDTLTWTVPGLTATGATFSQVAQRSNVATTTGNDSGLRVAEWDVSTGPASAAPVWTQTLSAASTGTGAMLRLREVTPDPASATIQSEGLLNEGVASPSLSLLSGDIILVIAGHEAAATISLAETGAQSVVLQEDQSSGVGSDGRMWTYTATGSESITVTMTDNQASRTSLAYFWHIRGGTLTGMTKVSAKDASPGNPSVVLGSVPTSALVLGGLVDFSATSNVLTHLRFTVADNIVVDDDEWVNGKARWVWWHTWQNATGTTQGPTAPTTMQATTFAIAIPPQTGVTQNAAAAFTAVGTMLADAIRQPEGAAAFVGNGVLSADSTQTQFAAPVLIGSGVLSAGAFALRPAAAVFAGVGTLVAAGARQQDAAAAFSGNGLLSVSAVRSQLGIATFNAVGTLVADAIRTAVAATTLAGVGTLSVSAVRDQPGAAAFAGVGTLSVSAFRQQFAAATFAGVGTLAVSAVRTQLAAAAFTGVGLMLADSATQQAAAAAFAAVGLMNADALRTAQGVAAFSGNGIMSVSAFEQQFAAAAFVGNGLLNVSALRTQLGIAAFAGNGLMSVSAFQVQQAAITLAGVGLLAASAGGFQQGAAAFIASGILSVTALRIAAAQAVLAGSGIMSVAAIPVRQAAVALAGAGTLTVGALRIQVGAADFVAIGTFGAAVTRISAASAFFAGEGLLFVATEAGRVKVWNGVVWEPALVKVWNGAQWQPADLKYFDGMAWR